jgi:hypothetical protein
LAFSDWRVQEIGALVRFLRAQKKPDLIVYAGDDIRRFRPPGKNYFQEIARLARFGICVVAGNDDPADTRQLMTGRSVYPVHSCALSLGRFAIVGVDGAPLSNQPDLGNGTAQYNASYSNAASLDASSLRLDHKLNSKWALSGRYNYSPSEIIVRGVNAGPLSVVAPTRISTQTATVGATSSYRRHSQTTFASITAGLMPPPAPTPTISEELFH